jgi:HAD superfamily hydrolase (TIGR01549 family)
MDSFADGIKVVIFDIGGTLIHINPVVFEKSIQKYEPGYKMTKDFRRADISAKTYALSGGKDNKSIHSLYFEKIVSELGITRDIGDKVVDDLVPLSLRSAKSIWNDLDKDAFEVLEYLGGKYKLGVISNNLGEAREQIENACITKFFQMIIDSNDLGVRKPNAKIFLYGAEKMGVLPDKCIYIGDMFEWDGIGPVGVGMKSILVYTSAESVKLAKNYLLIRVVDKLIEVKKYL